MEATQALRSHLSHGSQTWKPQRHLEAILGSHIEGRHLEAIGNCIRGTSEEKHEAQARKNTRHKRCVDPAGQWQKEKDSDRRRRTRRVTRVGVDAKVSSVSISSWKHPCATNLQRTLCGVSLRITHLQSTALSMSSCEQCSSGFSSKTSKPLMNDNSVIIPSFSSSSVNSGSTCIRHGSVRPGSCLISSVSSFVSTGITVSPTVTAETHAVNWVRSVSAPMACCWVSWMSSSDKLSSVWRFGLLIRSVAGSLTPFPSSGSDFSDSTSSATEGL